MSAEEIRKQLASYVLRENSLESFEDWFVPNSWNVRQSSDEESQKLVFAIEAALSEYSGGHIDENVLRRNLSEMAGRYAVTVIVGASSSPLIQHTGSSQVLTPAFEMQIGSVDIQPSMASV